MKLSTVTKRLVNAGFTISTNGTFYEASNVRGDVIGFTSNDGENVRRDRFSYAGATSCAPTYGLTLTACL